MGKKSDQAEEPVEGEISDRKISQLKKLAEKNFGRFAMQVEHLSEEVQKKLIEQLPDFRKLADATLESVNKSFDALLKSLDKGDQTVHDAYGEQRAMLAEMLKQPDLSLDEKLRINSLIADTVKGQHNLNAEAKEAKMNAWTKVVMVGGAVALGVVVAVTGGKIGFDQGKPQI